MQFQPTVPLHPLRTSQSTNSSGSQRGFVTPEKRYCRFATCSSASSAGPYGYRQRALDWLYAMFVFTVEIVILVAGILVGCLLMLLVSAIVCNMLKNGLVYREEASRRVIFIPAMDQIKHGRERKVQWETNYAMARWTRWFHQGRRSAVQRSRRCADRDGRTIWQTVAECSCGSRGSTNEGSGQSLVFFFFFLSMTLHLLRIIQSTSPSPTNTSSATFMTQISNHKRTAIVAVSQLFAILTPSTPPSPSLVATVMYLFRQVR